MALQLGGLASGLDTDTIVAQLMTAERQPRTRLAQQQSVVQARQRVLGDIATKLRTLQDAMDALSSPALYADTQTVESGDPTKVTATRTSGTGPGGYTIAVTQLASATQTSYTWTDPASDWQVGGATIHAGTSLDDAVGIINGDANATVYAADVGGRLVLTNRQTGATPIDTGTGAPLSGAQERLGRNAQWSLDGVAQPDSATNTITNGILGLTLTLKAPTTGVTVTVGAPATDAGAVTDKVKDLVSAYNDAMDLVRSRLEEETVKAPTTDADRAKGVLRGDPMLSALMTNLRRSLSDTIGGSPAGMSSLADLGITTGAPSGSAAYSKDSVAGRLVLDETKLSAALSANPGGVRRLLGGVTGAPGAMQHLEGVLSPLTITGGMLDERSKSADAELK
ncbi:MAG TPA: flagellar filament capping protein FliD, partial [Solirubrobacteraceae bacterium]|nr:flagellar filament capping protein FliD [Solirubrobacteraceae bacterium]